ncbi:MAG: ABC transporter ATP-binding protein [Candidatus Aureabacteria bacterium]|nr:ABC transporter ATP-binding protein [Candidatus Auribacterota bacterium]
MTMPVAKPRHPSGSIISHFRAFNRYLVPYWPLEALVLLAVFLSSSAGLIGPYLTRITIDQAFGGRDFHLFHILILAGFILYLLQGFLTVLNQYLSAYIGQRLTFDLRSEYIRHLFGLSYADIHRRPTGEQMYRVGQDIDTVSSLATDTIPQMVSLSLRLIFLLAICLYLNWQLTLATLLLSPLFYLQARYFGSKQRVLTRRIKEASQGLLAELEDSLSNIKLIKAFGKGPWAAFRYLKGRIRIIRLDLELVKVGLFANISAGLLNTLILTGFTYYVGFNVIKGYLTLGTLIALMIYLIQLFDAIKSLGGLYQGVMVRFVSWERVRETLEVPAEKERPEARALEAVRGEIAYRGVSFGYQPGKAVVREISFAVPAGSFAALVGPSGSGKTTLLALLLRLMRPWQGEITVDGCDLDAIRFSSLRPFLGLSLQEAFVLNRSIRENLSFGRAGASEEEMWRALAVADLEPTVREMENGLDALVGERGSNLSEGQRQRLAIARAVLGNPRIVVLDEATSAIGFDSEARILSNLRRELPGTTLLIASHRLLSLQDADKIVVLKDGAAVEEGNHRELMARNGFYSAIYREQSSRLEAGMGG